MDQNRIFKISVSPHLREGVDIKRIMYLVIVALLPAVVASIYIFGIGVIYLLGVCIFISLITEYLCQRVRKKKITLYDGSAILTGILLCLTLPSTFPLWAACLGAVVAILIGKQIFGGLGYNIFNPALVGRAFLTASFPALMTPWIGSSDTITAATPLAQYLPKFSTEPVSIALLKAKGIYTDLFLGKVTGCVGETSALALIVGGLFLIATKCIDWRIPVSYFGSVAVISGIFWIAFPNRYPDPLFYLLAGGLMLGGFFMATDPVTSPVTIKGKWVFGIGAGIVMMVIRNWGGPPEGVMYSILFMNALTPLINRYTRPRVLGE